MEYFVVLEKSKTGWSAYVPDLPGCIATSSSRVGVLKLIISAIEFHLEGLKKMGRRIPKPKSEIELVQARV